MRNLANFALFQAVWFGAVASARDGRVWIGFGATLVFVVIHSALIPSWASRRRELAFVCAVGIVGGLIDSALKHLGLLSYPTSDAAWSSWLAPPWIAGLWMAFAMLPRFSMAWLAGRPRLAAVLGAFGGPLSFFAGTRLGVVAPGAPESLTWLALGLEYALMTPLLLRFAPKE